MRAAHQTWCNRTHLTARGAGPGVWNVLRCLSVKEGMKGVPGGVTGVPLGVRGVTEELGGLTYAFSPPRTGERQGDAW